MVSLTIQVERRRKIRRNNAGKANKRQRRKGTPKFPIQPE